jgi:hypothetical protein
MAFFPPSVGPQGEPTGPQGSYRPPAEDPEDWHEAERGGPGRPKRPELSTTQILIGLVLVVLVLAAGARFLYTSAGPGFDGAILSPDNGARLLPGRVVFRVRASGEELAPRWELAFTRTDGPETWHVVGAGQQSPQPRVHGSGLLVVDITEPGPYRARLLMSDSSGRHAEDTVDFTIVAQ